MGTGAFSQMGADRSITVKVSNEDVDSALKFETKGNYPGNSGSGERSIYASVVGGNLEIDLASEGGANVNAEFMYRNVVQIQNTSDNLNLLLGVDLNNATNLNTVDDMEFYVTSSRNETDASNMDDLSDNLNFNGPGPNGLPVPDGSGFSAPEVVGPGESRYLHIYLDTSGNTSDSTVDVDFGAVDLNAAGI
jgi:hypothetical protein